MDELINIEVVYGTDQRQHLVRLQVAAGTTMRQAVSGCDLSAFVDVDVNTAPLGIFGKQVSVPEKHAVVDGDRIEIYRPLQADPMEVRRLRAAKAAQKAKK